MRARWEGLHVALVRSVSTLPADREFKEKVRDEPALARFESPTGLVEFLTGKHGDLDEKDRIYAALIRLVQTNRTSSRVVQAIAWLGVWPGLDAVYRRCLRHFREDEDDLIASISMTVPNCSGTWTSHESIG
jgi:RNA polymerase sigma-70 factor (ECF subfamily)